MPRYAVDRVFERRLSALVNSGEPEILQGGRKGVEKESLRVTPDGRQKMMLEDADAGHLDAVEQAYAAGRLGRPHLDTVRSTLLRNISSLAFGGPDLTTAWLGCLLGDSLLSFRSPVAGAPPVHWSHPLGPLASHAAAGPFPANGASAE